MLILGIESSCDDAAAAVIETSRPGVASIRSSIIANQDEIHRRYGGVVPELASRNHVVTILPVIEQALEAAGCALGDLGGIAVTRGPGLVGSLLVGLMCAKGLAQSLGVAMAAVNHIEGHLLAPLLEHRLAMPFLALVVSGGHTELFVVEDFGRYRRLGRTRDDAAGEAFDKVAKLLGLGYPGGPVIDRLARGADDRAVEFTVARIKDGKADFSFSGIKTAVLHHVRKNGIAPVSDPTRVPEEVRNLVASFQRAVVTALVRRLRRAAEERSPASLLLTGGVAANSLLRREAARAAEELGRPLFAPPIALSTDNAAMIAAAGDVAFRRGARAGWDLNAEPHLPLG